MNKGCIMKCGFVRYRNTWYIVRSAVASRFSRKFSDSKGLIGEESLGVDCPFSLGPKIPSLMVADRRRVVSRKCVGVGLCKVGCLGLMIGPSRLLKRFPRLACPYVPGRWV